MDQRDTGNEADQRENLVGPKFGPLAIVNSLTPAASPAPHLERGMPLVGRRGEQKALSARRPIPRMRDDPNCIVLRRAQMLPAALSARHPDRVSHPARGRPRPYRPHRADPGFRRVPDDHPRSAPFGGGLYSLRNEPLTLVQLNRSVEVWSCPFTESHRPGPTNCPPKKKPTWFCRVMRERRTTATSLAPTRQRCFDLT